MRRSLAWYSAPVSFVHVPSWADFITITSGFRFSVHTGVETAFKIIFGQQQVYPYIHKGIMGRQAHGRWSKADTAMSRWVIAVGLKLIVVPVDSTWMRRSLATRASHSSRARAGRSHQRQSKWAGSTRRCTRTALVTAPFLFGAVPAFTRRLAFFESLRPSPSRSFKTSHL